jgi:hypothetical protein
MFFGLPSLLSSIDIYQEEFGELLSLLLGLNPSTSGKKYAFWKEFDDYVAFNNIGKQTSYQEIITNCRRSILIMKVLCKYLEDNYPHHIPEVLFFVCTVITAGMR